MALLDLTTTTRDGVVTVAVHGELDIASTELLRSHLFELLDQVAGPGTEVVLALDGLTFVDATGLGALVAVHQRARRDRIRLRLSGVPPIMAKLLRITGLDTHLTAPAPRDTRTSRP